MTVSATSPVIVAPAAATSGQTNLFQLDTGQHLQAQPAAQTAATTSANTLLDDFTPMVSAAPEPKPELLPLTNVFVPLDKIQPGETVYLSYTRSAVQVRS